MGTVSTSRPSTTSFIAVCATGLHTSPPQSAGFAPACEFYKVRHNPQAVHSATHTCTHLGDADTTQKAVVCAQQKPGSPKLAGQKPATQTKGGAATAGTSRCHFTNLCHPCHTHTHVTTIALPKTSTPGPRHCWQRLDELAARPNNSTTTAPPKTCRERTACHMAGSGARHKRLPSKNYSVLVSWLTLCAHLRGHQRLNPQSAVVKLASHHVETSRGSSASPTLPFLCSGCGILQVLSQTKMSSAAPCAMPGSLLGARSDDGACSQDSSLACAPAQHSTAWFDTPDNSRPGAVRSSHRLLVTARGKALKKLAHAAAL